MPVPVSEYLNRVYQGARLRPVPLPVVSPIPRLADYPDWSWVDGQGVVGKTMLLRFSITLAAGVAAPILPADPSRTLAVFIAGPGASNIGYIGVDADVLGFPLATLALSSDINPVLTSLRFGLFEWQSIIAAQWWGFSANGVTVRGYECRRI